MTLPSTYSVTNPDGQTTVTKQAFPVVVYTGGAGTGSVISAALLRTDPDQWRLAVTITGNITKNYTKITATSAGNGQYSDNSDPNDPNLYASVS